MQFFALEAVRDRLQSDAPLNDFLEGIYGQPPKFFIGRHKATAKASDYPFIALVPGAGRQREKAPSQQLLSLVASVKDAELEQDGRIYRAVRVLARVEELMLAALWPQPIAAPTDTTPAVAWLGDANTATDYGAQHPLYEQETQILLTLR